MEKESLINFADLDGRERLEFEVSQLADGTLSAERRKFVLAAVARDESLQALLEDFQRIDGTLARQPDWSRVDLSGLEDNVMRVVRLDLEPTAAPASLPMTAAEPASSRAWWANPWSSVAAAAAALVIGVGIGAVLLSESGPATLHVEGPSQQENAAVATGELQILGPADARSTVLVEAGQSDVARIDDTAVLSVSGPDVAAVMDPNVQSVFPDFVAMYSGADSVVEVPSRVVVASVDASADTVERD